MNENRECSDETLHTEVVGEWDERMFGAALMSIGVGVEGPIVEPLVEAILASLLLSGDCAMEGTQ